MAARWARNIASNKERFGPMPETTDRTAQTQPAEYVQKFIEDLKRPECGLQTHYRDDPSSPIWDTTNWGYAGRSAILGALLRALEPKQGND